MTHLDTKFPTIVFKDFPLIEPSVIKQIMGDENIKLNHIRLLLS